MSRLPKVPKNLILSFIESHLDRETFHAQMTEFVDRGRKDGNNVLIDELWKFSQEYITHFMIINDDEDEPFINPDTIYENQNTKRAFLSGASFIYGLLSRAIEIEGMTQPEEE